MSVFCRLIKIGPRAFSSSNKDETTEEHGAQVCHQIDISGTNEDQFRPLARIRHSRRIAGM